MQRAIATVAALLILCGSAAAAGSGETEPRQGAEAGENAQSEGRAGEEILQFALSGDPDTLDPHKTSGTLTFQVLRSVYDTLVEPNEEGEIVPALAREWEVSEDQTRWTFHLRRGVTFHNGDTLTAADVKATLNRITAPGTGSPNAGEFEAIEEITTPDEQTVVLQLDRPFAPLLASLASGWGAILPKELIEAGHDFGSKPVGTGPFELTEWVRGTRISLRRNEDYWMDGHPKLDGVDINVITEGAVQLQGLLTGDLDIVDTVSDTDLDILRERSETKVFRYLSSLVLVLAMNTDREPLDDLTVRRAITQAIDKQAVLDVAYGGGRTVGTFMDYSNPYYVDFTDASPYDPGQARERLEEAGLDGGLSLDMAVPQNYEAHVAAAEVYQDMLEDVGIEARIRQVDWSTWLSSVYRGGNFDLTVIGHTGKLDPDGRLRQYLDDENYVGYYDEEMARRIERARRVTDVETRKELYTRVLETFASEVPHVYVGTPYVYVGMRENIEGFRVNPQLETFDFRSVEME